MILVSTIQALGSYSSPNTFFERDYADKYYEKGYTSAFFNRVSCLHIGKLTSDKQGTNAYTLNEESQFTSNILVVNLERRPDRKEMIMTVFKNEGIESYSFYKAIDGKQLIETEEISRLFIGNDFGSKRGVIGCALTHYTLWKQLLVDSTTDYYVIFEDDVKVCSNFKGLLQEYSGIFTSSTIDVLFLGYHIHTEYQQELHRTYTNLRIKEVDRSTFIGGTFAYIVNKKGAQKMIEYIEHHGIKHGIDYVMKIIPGLECWNAQPHIAFSDWFGINPQMDSDIQMDSDSLQLTILDKGNWTFYKGVDSTGGDITRISGNIHDLFKEANLRAECVAFNTLGYLKSSITYPLQQTEWIHGSEGIYIKTNTKAIQPSDMWITTRLQGGLGNRLFQFAAALGMAEKTGLQAVFYTPEILDNIHGKKHTVCSMFPTNPIIRNHTDILYKVAEEHPFKYTSLPTNPTSSVLIDGFRQSMSYFPIKGIQPLLHELLETSTWNSLQRKYGIYKESDKKVSWFIHMRLGDFIRTYDTSHITLDSYYKKVLQEIPKNTNILLFSDEPAKAYTIFQSLIPGLRLVEEKDEIVCLSLMSQCWGGAVVPNSTFSWWGAYFAKQKAPESFKAYYPKEWICSQYDIQENPVPSWGIQVSVNLVVDKDIWIFHKGLDSIGDDIDHIEEYTENGLFAIANARADCISFNTLGFLKSNVSYPLVKSQWFSENDGIYIKKKNNVLRVKLMCNWCSSEELCNEWNKMSKGNYTWNTIMIVSSDPADYYVIINKPQEGDYYESTKTIIFHMEPWCYSDTQSWGIKTWGKWATPDPSKFLQVRNHTSYINTAFWQVNWTYSDFKTKVIEKSVDLENTISSVCSSKYFDPGHIKRIDFLKFLESKNVKLDIYNSDNDHKFVSYKGRADPSIDKEKGLIPYKYYFMCENNAEKNFITEKLWEPIVCETLCFYWGCPNVSEYIDPKAYVQLNMDDFEESYTIIQEAIKSNLWEERLPYIKQAKEKVLEYYGFFPTLERILTVKTS
jgi:GR25 family glycosyltransferase involved in LPS biosynthesis